MTTENTTVENTNAMTEAPAADTTASMAVFLCETEGFGQKFQKKSKKPFVAAVITHHAESGKVGVYRWTTDTKVAEASSKLAVKEALAAGIVGSAAVFPVTCFELVEEIVVKVNASKAPKTAKTDESIEAEPLVVKPAKKARIHINPNEEAEAPVEKPAPLKLADPYVPEVFTSKKAAELAAKSKGLKMSAVVKVTGGYSLHE